MSWRNLRECGNSSRPTFPPHSRRPAPAWQLTAYDASQVVIDASGNVAADFTGSGVYLYLANAARGASPWTKLTPYDSDALAISAADVAAAFVGYYTTKWQQISPYVP